MGGLRVRYRSGSRAACAGRGRSCAFSHGGRSDGGPSASAITVSGPTYAISPVLTSTKPGSLPVAKNAPYGLCITLSNAFFATALHPARSEEHTSELPSLMRISYAVFCLKKKKQKKNT